MYLIYYLVYFSWWRCVSPSGGQNVLFAVSVTGKTTINLKVCFQSQSGVRFMNAAISSSKWHAGANLCGCTCECVRATRQKRAKDEGGGGRSAARCSQGQTSSVCAGREASQLGFWGDCGARGLADGGGAVGVSGGVGGRQEGFLTQRL